MAAREALFVILVMFVSPGRQKHHQDHEVRDGVAG